jgi:hypothetical protein
MPAASNPPIGSLVTISTLRFRRRPFSASLLATGRVSPNPAVSTAVSESSAPRDRRARRGHTSPTAVDCRARCRRHQCAFDGNVHPPDRSIDRRPSPEHLPSSRLKRSCIVPIEPFASHRQPHAGHRKKMRQSVRRSIMPIGESPGHHLRLVPGTTWQSRTRQPAESPRSRHDEAHRGSVSFTSLAAESTAARLKPRRFFGPWSTIRGWLRRDPSEPECRRSLSRFVTMIEEHLGIRADENSNSESRRRFKGTIACLAVICSPGRFR